MKNMVALFVCGVLNLSSVTAVGQSFINWENPHVHPLDVTPDGTRLLAVNLADNHLEVFDVSGANVVRLVAIPVGLDPVSVRARTNDEVWVVNHISDSISIVDLNTRNVIATLSTDDEPADVVFAGTPIRAFVSCSQANTVLVFDPNDLTAPPVRISIDGEDPRAMTVSTDGNEVYVAIFESGNDTTILGGGSTMGGGFPPNVVNDPLGPYGGVNPPPNSGSVFSPSQTPGNPSPPAVGLIVRKDAASQWMDDNSGDWTNLVSGPQAGQSGRPVGWNLHDHDVAIIDASTLSVQYATGVMNLCMGLSVNPASGLVTVIGTDATNEVRFEPNLTGRFLRVNLGLVNPATLAAPTVVDLNSHLTYVPGPTFTPLPQAQRDQSLGDPRAIVWNSTGTRGYVVGMGSNNLVIIDAAGNRIGVQPTLPVGEGPTGLVLDESSNRLYVLNKFEASISVVDTTTETELSRVPFHDATPDPIRIGRKHLYDTHRSSGLGHISCASCHADARMDRLSWDLGDPSGSMKTFDQNCLGGGCEDWHPMKGPMTTQTLQDIIGKEPLHWRGDKAGLEEFAGAFRSLQGDDIALPPADMQEFEDFLATIHFPPNPFRGFDNTLPTDMPLPGHFTPGVFGPEGLPLPNGDAQAGLLNYRTGFLDGVQCVSCHTLPTGIGPDGALEGFVFVPIPPGPNGERHHGIVSVDGSTNASLKIPQMRNMYEKVGFETTQISNSAGFGFIHDGSVDSLARFVTEPVFSLASVQEVSDMVAFMLAFSGSDLPVGSPSTPLELPGPSSQDTHAAVGMQTTLVDAATADPAQLTFIANMISLANTGAVGLVVKGRQGGIQRGYAYQGGNLFQSDRATETIAANGLQTSASLGEELTYTVVPAGNATRIGIDRDEDGFLDRDELDACSDPANSASVPGGGGSGGDGDGDGDGDVDLDDYAMFVTCIAGPGEAANAQCLCAFDANGDSDVDLADYGVFQIAFTGP